jgi:hypothetical protein
MNLLGKIKILNKKLLVLIIIVGVSILWFFLANSVMEKNEGEDKIAIFCDEKYYLNDGSCEKITESDDNSIYGFAIDDAEGNVTHYPIDKLDEIPCHDFMGFWNEEFRTVDEHEILIAKYDACFEETFGGPGNRHPAFVGYEIPKNCTKDMIKHLVKHSNMFFADEENFSLEWIGLPDSINKNNYDICFDDLLELRKKRSSELETQFFFLPVAYAMHTDDGAHTTPFRWPPPKPGPAPIEDGEILSPKKQVSQGIEPEAVVCNEGLVLILRHNGSPACVKERTAEIFEERGWGSIPPPCCKPTDLSLEMEHATSSYMEKIIPTLDEVRDTLSVSEDLDTIFFKFGKPHYDIGSGIHIYVYDLNDSTQVWIGYTDKILYVYHVDSDGNILEQLF